MVPLGARSAAAVVGALLILAAGASVVETLFVPRMVTSRLSHWVSRVVNASFGIGTSHIADYRRRDRVLAVQAATILLAQLTVWMTIALTGYGLTSRPRTRSPPPSTPFRLFWSGPRRSPTPAIRPIRPPLGRPPR